MPELDKPIYRNQGDTGLLVELGQGVDPELNQRVRALATALLATDEPGVSRVLPAYNNFLVIYDPLETGPERLAGRVEALAAELASAPTPQARTVEIPVCYGGEMGPDLEFVAEHAGLSPEEVIKRHSQPAYLIYLMGFSPGFPYLGGLPAELAAPRLETPRALVPAGSVGIANQQTGVYPSATPGGWRIIGRTPLRLFDPGRENPFSFAPGDRLKFAPISPDEYAGLAGGE